MTEKPKREGPLKIDLSFDDAIRRAFKVKPPPGGWANLGKKPRKDRKRQKRKSAA